MGGERGQETTGTDTLKQIPCRVARRNTFTDLRCLEEAGREPMTHTAGEDAII
ncbi:hypothetical protein DPMN_001758 [Dreissena polymorpha]|uniref:Uncharacterized protein n=1 Tax=Dreissena polymorpha TaxID=45954 RepID=A0A9D4MIZ2_DREPO|nr:hypothetical protein DPMN_001758 [Dreissena polymorpha]